MRIFPFKGDDAKIAAIVVASLLLDAMAVWLIFVR